MRIAIDLQSCQHADAALAGHTLALVQHLIAHASEHTVWVALSNQFPDRIDRLREALRSSLPADRVRLYDTPPADGSARVQQTIDLIREYFFASLGADIVFAPGMFDPDTDAVGSISHAAAPFLTALSVSDPTALTASARALASVQRAGLVFASSAALAEHMQSLTEPARVLQIDTDLDRAAQQILHAFEQALPTRAALAALAAPTGRPLLAYISPLPPQQSGVADYSAELIAELDHYYDVHLIVPEPQLIAPDIGARWPLHDCDWFDRHAGQFSRILYHIGNSQLHHFMFEMLQRHPGIIVLHDFFLSNTIDQLERHVGVKDAFRRALFDAHGYSGIADHLTLGRNDTIWKYPANKNVLDAASGVIVHSRFACELADTWYGSGSSADWHVVPLLRGGADDAGGRADARAALGIADDDFLICSFGMLGSSKLNAELLEAFTRLQRRPAQRCQLVFVGADDPAEYGIALHQKIAASGLQDLITITGFVSASAYKLYLQAADVAVQLRGLTRGETSASVLDCLLYGIATIVNANGANRDLPADIVSLLPDRFHANELAQALTQLYQHADQRSALGARAKAYVRQHHAPAPVGRAYVDAIETISQRSPAAHYRKLLQAIHALGAPSDPRHHELFHAAKAIAANQPASSPRQLFIDVSALAQCDLKTGIQRVVRSILLALIAAPPPGYRIEPVYGNGGNQPYQYARRFALGLIGDNIDGLEDMPINYRCDDIFLGLDLVANATTQNEALLNQMRQHGVKLVFVVYDLLPLLLPNAFPYGTEHHFREYIETISRVSDQIVCISQAVADELADWLTQHAPARCAPLELGYFHLGADIAASVPSKGLPPNADQVMEAIASRPTILMVGTVEPRKGHEQALAAFDLLWSKQVEVNLVIVGKPGWMVDGLTKKLQQHRMRNKKLFWLAGASDEMLTKLYESSSGLLAASIGEGFGLPLIEAAQHQLPIIARDIPVFREVSKEHAFYFEGQTPAALAEALTEWLRLLAAEQIPASAGMPWLTWTASAQQLLSNVTGTQRYRSLAAAVDSTI